MKKVVCLGIAFILTILVLPIGVASIWVLIEGDFGSGLRLEEIHQASGLSGDIWQASHFIHHLAQVAGVALSCWVVAGITYLFSMCDEYVDEYADSQHTRLAKRTLEIGDRRVIKPIEKVFG